MSSCCLVLAAMCQLLAAMCQLLAAMCQLLAAMCQLLTSDWSGTSITQVMLDLWGGQIEATCSN